MKTLCAPLKILAVSLCLLNSSGASAHVPTPIWPTPNRAFDEGERPDAYFQPTASGIVGSAGFGCVRSSGARFHEGIDLLPVQRDKKGRVKDSIYAIWPGKIVYINTVAGNSSYGLYIVIEHTTLQPALYSLYAHLQSVAPNIHVGKMVDAGDIIGVMGNSSTLKIPKSRSHLHLEIGLRLSDNFGAWYKKQDFSVSNHHGLYNGMNLLGLNPIEIFKAAKANRLNDLTHFIQRLPTAFKLRFASTIVPDYIRRYPTLLQGALPPKDALKGWEIEFTWYGLPKSWTPLTITPTGTLKSPQIVEFSADILRDNRCRKTVTFDKKGKPKVDKELRNILDMLFI